MLKNYAKKSFLLLFLAVVIFLTDMYVRSTTGLGKALGYMFAFCIIVPTLANTLAFFVIPEQEKKKKFVPDERTSKYVKNLYATREQNNINSGSNQVQENVNTVPNQHKSNPSQLYVPCRDMVSACSKNSIFTRDDVLNILNEVDYRLGSAKHHYSNFNFQNDIHEIYIKLKNKKLKDEDYNHIMQLISKTVEVKTNESNIN